MYLVFIIYQKQHFGVILVHDGQEERLEDGALQHRRGHLAPPSKDGIEDVEGGQAGLLHSRATGHWMLRHTEAQAHQKTLAGSATHRSAKPSLLIHTAANHTVLGGYTGKDGRPQNSLSPPSVSRLQK